MSIIKTLNYSCKISLKEQEWKCNKEDSINFLDVFFIHLIKTIYFQLIQKILLS